MDTKQTAADIIKHANDDGWEVEINVEGGQTDGFGVIEPSDSRDWYTDAREAYHRTKIVLTGPWEDGPTESAAAAQQRMLHRQKAEEDYILKRAEGIMQSRGLTP